MKNRIRKEILEKRASMGEAEWIEKSVIIQTKLINSGFYKSAGCVLLYCHFDREVRTDLLIKDAFASGKTVGVPFNDWENNEFLPSRIRSEKDINVKLRIPQPFILESMAGRDIELAVMPGVAFDSHGNRAGMGKGFYDRFLAKYGAGFLKAAVVFDFQVIAGEIPSDSWDVPVDLVITETRTIDCRK